MLPHSDVRPVNHCGIVRRLLHRLRSVWMRRRAWAVSRRAPMQATDDHTPAPISVACVVCRCATPLDDVARAESPSTCVCLACDARARGVTSTLPAALRRELDELLSEPLAGQ